MKKLLNVLSKVVVLQYGEKTYRAMEFNRRTMIRVAAQHQELKADIFGKGAPS